MKVKEVILLFYCDLRTIFAHYNKRSSKQVETQVQFQAESFVDLLISTPTSIAQVVLFGPTNLPKKVLTQENWLAPEENGTVIVCVLTLYAGKKPMHIKAHGQKISAPWTSMLLNKDSYIKLAWM